MKTEVLPGLAEATGDRRASTFNYIESTINPQRVAELTTARLSAFVSMLREGGMKDTTLACSLGAPEAGSALGRAARLSAVDARYRYAEAGQGRLAGHAGPSADRRRIGPDVGQGRGSAQA